MPLIKRKADMDRIQTKIGTVWEEKSAEGGDIADTYHDDA